MEIIRSRPQTASPPSEWFTGRAYIDEIAGAESASRLRAYRVHFTPGARTAWHSHPNGQIIHITEGVGRVQRRGGPVEELNAGDTARVEPGEEHWHGAAPNNFMTHLALHEADADGVDAHWGPPVSDEEYGV